jgi:hypothetical protein
MCGVNPTFDIASPDGVTCAASCISQPVEIRTARGSCAVEIPAIARNPASNVIRIGLEPVLGSSL